MGAGSKIEWCDHTWNPWHGCTKVSPGCAHCYAERMTLRFSGAGFWGPQGQRKMMSEAYWKQPIRGSKQKWLEIADWRGPIEKTNSACLRTNSAEHASIWDYETRQRGFCGSMCDGFEDRVDP